MVKIVKNDNGDIIEMSFFDNKNIVNLPKTLKKLFINSNSICLENLPDNIEELIIICNNFLREVLKIEKFPKNLKRLQISSFKIDFLPKLPQGLQILECFYINELTSLPELPQGLLELYCYYSSLTSLPEIPQSLLTLNCSINKLTSLPELPLELQSLECSNNQLTLLPELPQGLQKLDCYNNNITSLSKLPQGLQELICSANKLTSLPELPQRLQYLSCSNNKITSLPELPQGLKRLNCHNIQLAALPDLPQGLQYLDCFSNNITTLGPLLNCRNLNEIRYFDNPIEYIPEPILRILNRNKNVQNVYNDAQNVHNHTVQESTRKSIQFLVAVAPTIKNITEYIMNDPILNKRVLFDYMENKEIHSILNITFEELLQYVLSRIEEHSQSTEIKRILNQEMEEAECKCFTGRITRLVNCLVGFYPEVQIQISDTEQIGNVISSILRNDKIENKKEEAEKRLRELGYSQKVIEEWVSEM